MLESLFLSPWSMVAGGALVSSPIIIHLINRMRFKRVRWAAMEFLLKSQKRNRRRLIIEQLILLLLRILLVLLAALLVARFVGYAFGVFKPQNTLHVILIDDTPSMGDHWREDGEAKDSFKLAQNLVVDGIAKEALQASAAQNIVVLRLSNLNEPKEIERLNSESQEELRNYLGSLQVSPLHVDLKAGIDRAQQIFNSRAQDERMLHIISDFRQRDWSGAQADSLTQALQGLAQARVKLRMVDTAHPYRRVGQQAVGYHDNLAVTRLAPETRVAARFMPIQFDATVANYSGGPRENVRLTIKVDGVERPEASVTLPVVPPGSDAPGNKTTFTVWFDSLGFKQVTANLEDEEAGLQIDNVRYAVVEVRERVPLLVIDGDLSRGLKDGGDTFHIQAVFDPIRGAAKGYEVVPRGVNELENADLNQYAGIYLLNVRELSDKAVQNLENYTRQGGGVAFFLGERVSPEFYTSKLYCDGKGLFPAPLADRPNPPLSEEERTPEFSIDQFQAFLRKGQENHPIFASFADDARYLQVYKVLGIKRYFPVPRSKWQPDPEVQELLTLPNQRAIEEYRESTQSLLEDIPLDDPQYEKYRPALVDHSRAIRDVLATGPLYKLANALNFLLTDQGDPKDPQKPNLVEFWGQPDMRRLRDEIERFRETVQLGDPLMVSRQFGKGRVVAVMTSAGQAWNDWAGGSIYAAALSANYVTMMIDLQKYLANAAGDSDRVVGSPLTLDVEAARYDSKIRRFYQPEPKGDGAAAAPAADDKSDDGAEVAASGLDDLGEQIEAADADGRIRFTFTEARRPGVYRFQLYPRDDMMGMGPRREERAFAFNIDTTAESDLKRGSSQELETAAPGLLLRGAEASFDEETYHQSDLSEMPWLFLIFLLILVAEQALAVHLSFHLKGTEAPAPAVRPIPA